MTVKELPIKWTDHRNDVIIYKSIEWTGYFKGEIIATKWTNHRDNKRTAHKVDGSINRCNYLQVHRLDGAIKRLNNGHKTDGSP